MIKSGKSKKFSPPHDRLKASTASEYESGCHEIYSSGWLFICDTKRSISGKNLNFVNKFLKIDLESCHPTFSLTCLGIKSALCKKFPYSEFSWSIFSCIWTEYREILCISPYSVQMLENMNQKNFEYGKVLRRAAVMCLQPGISSGEIHTLSFTRKFQIFL